MPFTKDENTWYAITVRHDGRDHGGWSASAEIWRRDRSEGVGEAHYGNGPSLIAAEQAAYRSARRACPQRRPDDWSSNGDGT